MKLSKTLILIFIFLPILFTACTSAPSQKPTQLTVQRVGMLKHVSPRTWTITNAQAVQQLFQEVHNLPLHHNNGTDSCAESYYVYHLNFFVGTTSIEKDDIGSHCNTLTTADGTAYDQTDAFIGSFSKLLNVSPNDL